MEKQKGKPSIFITASLKRIEYGTEWTKCL